MQRNRSRQRELKAHASPGVTGNLQAPSMQLPLSKKCFAALLVGIERDDASSQLRWKSRFRPT
jgi:hypothetical protein